MNALDSPFEALALNYVSFGFLTIVNNLWTWVAVITAAVSFWRIRAVESASCSVKADHPSACLDSSLNGSQTNPVESSPEPASESPTPLPAPAISPSKCDVNHNGVTKGKFTVYYEDESESDGELTVVKEWGYNGGEGCGEWWERVMSMRMGDLGWYRCQDLTAINGNVVRLWDNDDRTKGRYSPSCAVW